MNSPCSMLLACLLPLVALPVCDAQDKSVGRRSIGVSLAGAEFGAHAQDFSNRKPGDVGAEYTFPTPRTIRYFGQRGLRLLRIPFRWERIQPNLGAKLDPQQIRELKRICRSARQTGSNVVLDLHNYGRYRIFLHDAERSCVIDEQINGKTPVSREHFADFWKRMALEFRNEESVIGYGIMNEPHDMGQSNWKEISQTAVDSIRRVDRKTSILVAGDEWSNAQRFAAINGPAWINDPVGRVVYEAHCYFDQDGSGKYSRSFRDEQRLDPMLLDRGQDRVAPFIAWCKRNQVRGFVGEFGTPADAGWQPVVDRFLDACFADSIPVCYWAAGEWWGDYSLSIQPSDSEAPAQLKWLMQAMN